MAIWSMGSQTQILIGYLPVPAPLLCKYWTSTFFTVTCIWKKKKKKSEESQRAVVGGWWGGRCWEQTWLSGSAEGKLPPSSLHYLPAAPLILSPKPPTNKCNSQPVPPSFRTKRIVCRSWCIRVIVHCRNCLYWGWFKKKKKNFKHLILDQLDIN